ncbi:MAG: cytochrome c3 family protein [Bacillota bacterium]
MRSKLVLLLPAALILVALTAALNAGVGATAEPVPPKAVLACAECHSMEVEVDQWAESVHSNLTCLECHTEGDVTWVRHEFLERNEEMAAHPGEHKTIKLKADLARCETCHEPQWALVQHDLIPGNLIPQVKTVPHSEMGKKMDIRVAHSLHVNGEKLECVACHLNAVHGPAPGTPERRDDAHQLCMDCHEQEDVKLEVKGDVSCAACHLDVAKITPADHKDVTAWKRAHGTASATQRCGDCHMSASAGPQGRLANPVFFPTTTRGDDCTTCHADMPMPHPDNFLARHGKEALSAKPGTCQTCHAPAAGEVAVPDHAGPKYCTECHLKPMPHPDNFLAVHGKEALQAPAVCTACHSSQNPVNPRAAHASKTYCGACHDAYQHPKGWVAGHGAQVTGSCATCHSMKEEQGTHNACAACHTSEGTWHEKMWFAKHGRVVEAQGDESCAVCHSEVEPSCSKCHAGR